MLDFRWRRFSCNACVVPLAMRFGDVAEMNNGNSAAMNSLFADVECQMHCLKLLWYWCTFGLPSEGWQGLGSGYYGEWRWRSWGDRLPSHILPYLSNYVLIDPLLSPSLHSWHIYEVLGAGSGVECIFGCDNTVYERGAGATAATSEREHNSSGPGGITRDMMHRNNATINIDDIWIEFAS